MAALLEGLLEPLVEERLSAAEALALLSGDAALAPARCTQSPACLTPQSAEVGQMQVLQCSCTVLHAMPRAVVCLSLLRCLSTSASIYFQAGSSDSSSWAGARNKAKVAGIMSEAYTVTALLAQERQAAAGSARDSDGLRERAGGGHTARAAAVGRQCGHGILRARLEWHHCRYACPPCPARCCHTSRIQMATLSRRCCQAATRHGPVYLAFDRKHC